ncbi:unnamed protein product [Protopolystoma xenopodis]|uniref:Uncharacterized protein n=1 Tax=Protopolystoma xenopodis TaxID=117903 RepID=A0A448WPK7_9PLAT|nr:unnamed protein product [Protopolystoma xenopodis]
MLEISLSRREAPSDPRESLRGSAESEANVDPRGVLVDARPEPGQELGLKFDTKMESVLWNRAEESRQRLAYWRQWQASTRRSKSVEPRMAKRQGGEGLSYLQVNDAIGHMRLSGHASALASGSISTMSFPGWAMSATSLANSGSALEPWRDPGTKPELRLMGGGIEGEMFEAQSDWQGKPIEAIDAKTRAGYLASQPTLSQHIPVEEGGSQEETCKETKKVNRTSSCLTSDNVNPSSSFASVVMTSSIIGLMTGYILRRSTGVAATNYLIDKGGDNAGEIPGDITVIGSFTYKEIGSSGRERCTENIRSNPVTT